MLGSNPSADAGDDTDGEVMAEMCDLSSFFIHPDVK
jgi:hypothetical protein